MYSVGFSGHLRAVVVGLGQGVEVIPEGGVCGVIGMGVTTR